LTAAGEKLPPLKGKVGRTKVGDTSFLTLKLDGSMVPWDEVPLVAFEDKDGEFDDLVKHLKAQKLTLSLGVRGDYLVFGLTGSGQGLEKLGGPGKRLADRPELKPLGKFVKEKITSLSYTSKEFNTRLARGEGAQLDTITRYARELLETADIPAAKRRAIKKD